MKRVWGYERALFLMGDVKTFLFAGGNESEEYIDDTGKKDW